MVFKTTCPTCELAWPYLERVRQSADGRASKSSPSPRTTPAKTREFNRGSAPARDRSTTRRPWPASDRARDHQRPDVLPRRRRGRIEETIVGFDRERMREFARRGASLAGRPLPRSFPKATTSRPSSPAEARATPAGSWRARVTQTPKPQTLGELKASGYRPRGVKEELRANLRRALSAGENPFPGIHGYERTVLPGAPQRDPLQARPHPARAARPGEDAPAPHARQPARRRDPGDRGQRAQRGPVRADHEVRPARSLAEKGDARADRLDPARGALPREARDARRHDRRPHRRHRPDQGRDRAPHVLRRGGHPLRHHPAHQPRHLRDQRAARTSSRASRSAC